MRLTVLTTAIISAVILCACGVVPLEKAPFGEKSQQPDKNVLTRFYGNWISRDASLRIEDFKTTEDKNPKKIFRILYLKNTDSNGKPKLTYLPLIGAPFLLNGKIYFVVCVDLSKVVETGKLNKEYFPYMLRVNYYLIQTEFKQENLSVQLVEFSRKEQDKDGKEVLVLTDSRLKKVNGIITNSEKEILGILKDEKFVLTHQKEFHKNN